MSIFDGKSWTPNYFRNNKFMLMGNGSQMFTQMQIFQLVNNPAIPYVGEFPGLIETDLGLVFQGKVPADANRFGINFKTGKSENDDIAFHFNPRFGLCIALNSFRNGTWEAEELTPVDAITRGGDFFIILYVTSEGYEVYLNGFKTYIFNHRIPLEKVSVINVFGNVSLSCFGFFKGTPSHEELKAITSKQTVESGLTYSFSDFSQRVTYPAVPYWYDSGSLKPGMALYLEGSLEPKRKYFAVNFQTGRNEGADIAFQYNPRFGSYTALNSFINGTWGKEESAPDKPFTRGDNILIVFVFKSNAYEVSANGTSHCIFKHRIPLEKVSAIQILGDIRVHEIGLIRNYTGK